MRKLFLAAVLIVKNECESLDEWISYHVVQGFEHFFIYDNGSEDRIHDVLKLYINHGLVTLLSWQKDSGQTDCYRHALRFFGPSVEWMSFTDVDEFIYMKSGLSLRNWIESLSDNISQVKFPWRNFTFSGHIRKPLGLTIENFNKAEPIPVGGFQSIGAKPIVRCDDVRQVYVHMCSMLMGTTVDPLLRESSKSTQIEHPDYSIGQINHYYYKSVEEFENKMRRGQVDGGKEKGFFKPNDELLYGGDDESVSEQLIEAVRQKIKYFRSFDEQPSVYGTFLPDHYGHNITQWKFELALGHSMQNTARISNRPIAIPVVKASWGTVIYDLEKNPFNLGDLCDSIHFNDFLRHTRTEVKWTPKGSFDKDNESIIVEFPEHKMMRKVIIFVSLALRSTSCAPPDAGEENLQFDLLSSRTSAERTEISLPSGREKVILFHYLKDKYIEICGQRLCFKVKNYEIQSLGVGLQS